VSIPIRLKLVLGLAAIIALMSAGASYLFLAVHEVGRAMDEVRRGGEAVRDSLTLAASIREQYAHEAHVFLLSHPHDHVEHYETAEKNTRNCLARLRGVSRGGPEQEIVERIEAEAERFGSIFVKELLPAFERGERERALEDHERSEAVLEGVVRLIDELSGRYLAHIDDVQHRAEGLKTRAFEAGAAILLLTIGLAAAIAAYLVRSIHRPIEALTRGTEAVACGDLDAKITLAARDEFGVLAESFNEMTSRLRGNQTALLRAEKAASLGDLAAGVAHQLNNPLGVIVGYAGILADPRYDEAARAKAVASIQREAEECRTTVRDLMSLARPGTLEVETVSTKALFEAVLEKLARYTRLDHLRIERGPTEAESLSVETDRRKLEQALLNLVANAAEAMPERGTLALAARASDGRISLEVSDTGPGFDAAIARRFFDPYFTTKPRGTGLGLAFAHGLVRALGGEIEVDSDPGRGARFRIVLPERPSGSAPAPSQGAIP